MVETKGSIKEIEEEILRRVTELEKSAGNGNGWLKKNWFSVVSTAGMILALGVGWGTTREQILQLQSQRAEQAQQFHQAVVMLNSQLVDTTRKVDAHHDNRDVHVDALWKQQIVKQLDDIRTLIISHINTTRDRARLGEPR